MRFIIGQDFQIGISDISSLQQIFDFITRPVNRGARVSDLLCTQNVRALDAVVYGDGDSLAGDALGPRALHVHVDAVAAVQVPHLGEPAMGKR